MKKFFDWLCGVSSDSKGAGLGRGTNRGSNLEWWQMLAKLKPAAVIMVVLTVSGPEAMAGNRRDDGGGYNDLGWNGDRDPKATQVNTNGFWKLDPNICCPAGVRVSPAMNSVNWGNFVSWALSFVPTQRKTTVTYDKVRDNPPSQGGFGWFGSSGYSISGRMDPNSRGSGVVGW